MLGKQIGPMFRHLPISFVAGDFIRADQARSDIGADVDLNETVRIGLLVGLSLRRATDEEPRPRMIGRRQAVVQHVVGGHGDDSDGGRIARVAIIVDLAQQQAECRWPTSPLSQSFKLGSMVIVPSGLMFQTPLKM